MSARKLPREWGMVIRCDHWDRKFRCPEQVQTAVILAGANRAHAAKLGWGRGLRKGHKRMDLCPKHMAEERTQFEVLKAEAAARRKAREEKRLAKKLAGKVPA